MKDEETAIAPSQAFASRVRSVREAHGLSQQSVCDRLGDLGIHLDRAGLAKIELMQRRASLDEGFAICAALGVSPRAMFLPAADDQPVAVAPGLSVTAAEARRWLDGAHPLPGDDPNRFEAELSDGDRRVARNRDLARIRMLTEPGEQRIRAGEDDPTITAVADVIYEAILRTAKFTPLQDGSE